MLQGRGGGGGGGRTAQVAKLAAYGHRRSRRPFTLSLETPTDADDAQHLDPDHAHYQQEEEEEPDRLLEPLETTKIDCGCLTDLCTSENLPEVEIISLLEEQIPRYKLRADTLTSFTGYENQDWFVPAPALPASVGEDLTPEQIKETLNYFLLCSNRVSQMTKTYNDVEAVTRLLEEKEKDLELAARIGQGLLSRNRALEERIAAVEGELSAAHDTVTQLRHDLSMKADLLHIYTNDYDDASPDGARAFSLETLLQKVRGLETDNQRLRVEASQLARETSDCEQREDQLLNEVLKQLADANGEVKVLAEEVARKSDESFHQQEEITSLLAQLVDQRHKIRELTLENEDLLRQLEIVRQCQNDLAMELADSKDKYAEIVDLLRETQEQLKKQRKRNYSGGRLPANGSSISANSAYGSFNPDSLASELEFSSLGSELWGSEPIAVRTPRNQLQRIFDTVRCASQTSVGSPLTSLVPSSGCVFSSQTRMSVAIQPLSETPATEAAPTVPAEAATPKPTEYPGTSKVGVPGTPGTVDLTNALRRLEPKSRPLAGEKALEPQGWRTPDSIMSTGSRRSGSSLSPWRLPEKLKIVKPVEGSATLNTWSRLATPNFGNLLEERPGVATRDTHEAAVGYSRNLLELYSLSDYEEDEEVTHPGKSFEAAGTIYTYTNSTVMHPDDITQLTSSLQGTRMSAVSPFASSVPGGEAPGPVKAPATPPRSLSRRNSVSTFSTHLSLAKALHERGTVSVNPPGIASDLSTPCNSPEPSSPDEPFPYGAVSFLHRGARLLRRAFTGEEAPVVRQASKSVHAEPKAMKSCDDVQRPENLGLNCISVQSRSVSPVILRSALENLKQTENPQTDLTLPTEGLTWSGTGTAPPAPLELGEIRIPSQSAAAPSESFGPGYRRPVNALRFGQPAKPGMGHLQRIIQYGELPVEKGLNVVTDWETLNTERHGALDSKAKTSAGEKKMFREDLGTVGPTARPRQPANESGVISFIGTLSSFLFGRKGGLL